MCKYSYFTFSGAGKEEYKYITCKGNYLRPSACCSSRVTRRYNSWNADNNKKKISTDRVLMMNKLSRRPKNTTDKKIISF